MVDYSSAIKRPFTDWKKLSIGVLLYMIPFLNIITGPFATGYILRAIKKKGNFALPEWTDWGDLFVKGFLAAVINIIYWIPAIITGLILMGSAMLSVKSLASGSLASGALIGASVIGTIITILIALITYYISPAAVIRYARTGNFGEAFALGDVFSGAFTGKYLAGWIVSLIYVIVLMIIWMFFSWLLAFTVVIPWIIMGIFSFVAAITTFTILNEALE